LYAYTLQGHSEELWAIAGHPSEPEFITAGYDQMVMMWNSQSHRLLWKTPVEVILQCNASLVTEFYGLELYLFKKKIPACLKFPRLLGKFPKSQ